MIRNWRLSALYGRRYCHRMATLCFYQSPKMSVEAKRLFQSTTAQIDPGPEVVSDTLEVPHAAQQLHACIEKGDYNGLGALLAAVRPGNLSQSNYQLLLKACSHKKDPNVIPYALQFYRAAVSSQSSARRSSSSALYFLMMCFIHCDDLNSLAELKSIWETAKEKDQTLLPLYYAAFVHFYLNTEQVCQAEDLFERAFGDLNQKLPTHIASHTLPSIRLLHSLVNLRDCDALVDFVALVYSEEKAKLAHNQSSILEEKVWLDILQVGLLENNYQLVKSILDKYIMKDFQAGVITSDDVLLNTRVPELFQNQSLSDEIVYAILHTLASNGDVAATLAVIESFYIHRAMKGEKALTKGLYLKVIESYCAYLTPDEEMKATNGDPGVKRVIDVIGGLHQRYKHDKTQQFSYKDITSTMSEKFVKFRIQDRNVESAQQRRQQIEQSITESELNDIVTTVKPRKVSNPNIHTASKGNILANLETLETFTQEHMEYIQTKQFPQATAVVFVNCLLNHVNLYQNFSGMVRLLNILHKINVSARNDWLDRDAYNIILNSMANSNTAKPSAVILYEYLQGKFGGVTHEQYAMLVNSILRGDFRQELEFFVYKYLTEHNSKLHSSIRAQIKSIPLTAYPDPTFAQFLHFVLQEPSPEEIGSFWAQQGLRKTPPTANSTESLPGFNRKYFHELAVRDAKFLQYFLA